MKTNLTDADIGVLVAAAGSGGSLPTGLICMWGGLLSAIPSGWLLCDGTSGTPDLRSKFIKGSAAGIDPGLTGGSATASYTPAGTISTPTFTGNSFSSVINHTHAVTVTYQAQGSTTAATTGTHSMTSTATGGSARALTSGDVVSATTANPAGGVSSITPTGSVSTPTFTGTLASIATEPDYVALAYIMKS